MSQASSSSSTQEQSQPVYALEIENLKKVYDNGLTAVKDVSLKIEQGDFFALLGHNGAGKSTTINIISGLFRKSDGKVKVFGHDLDKEPNVCKALIGVVPQESMHHYGVGLLEMLIVQGGLYGIPAHEAKIRGLYWLDKMRLLDRANAFGKELSGGMLRRFMIAKALMHNPKLLILDEPTAGVDVAIRHEIWEFLEEINKLGVTIILTTHYLEEAEQLCNNIAIIQSGEIKVRTSMKELITSVEDEMYTIDIEGYQDQELVFDGAQFVIANPTTLTITVNKKTTLTKVLAYLEDQGISIKSLRNTQNRLERIFLEYKEPQDKPTGDKHSKLGK